MEKQTKIELCEILQGWLAEKLSGGRLHPSLFPVYCLPFFCHHDQVRPVRFSLQVPALVEAQHAEAAGRTSPRHRLQEIDQQLLWVVDAELMVAFQGASRAVFFIEDRISVALDEHLALKALYSGSWMGGSEGAIFVAGFVHGNHVHRRADGLQGMAGSQDVSPARAQDGDILLHLCSHFFGAAQE